MTPKQRAFAEHYLLGHCGAAAAVRAGYAPKAARQTAFELLAVRRARTGRRARGGSRTKSRPDQGEGDRGAEGGYRAGPRAGESRGDDQRVARDREDVRILRAGAQADRIEQRTGQAACAV
jgi:terminase small subunit-like protein